MEYKELLAGCLQLHAEKLMEASRSHFEPEGLQASAQAVKAKELLDWSRREIAATNSKRDFTLLKLSKEEIASAIEFAETEVERLDSLMTVELEKVVGPIEKVMQLDRTSTDRDMSAGFQESFRSSMQFQMDLFYFRLVLRFL